MKKILLFFIFISLSFASEIKITLQPENFSEIKNYLKNSNFEEKGFWREYSSKIVDGKWENVEKKGCYTDEEKFSGKSGYKIVGERGINSGISQSIRFDNEIEKGNFLYLSYRIKTKGTTIEGGSIGPAIQATFSDNKAIYLPGLTLQKGIYTWDKIEWIYELPENLKSLTIYFTYYDQEGECFYDDIVFSILKKEKIKYIVEGSDIEKIRIFGKKGLIKEIKVEKEINKYEEEIELLPDEYYIEVEDKGKRRYVRVINQKGRQIKEGEINISYLEEEAIPFNGEKEYFFKINKEEGKKYILSLKARLNSEKLAGYTQGLKISLNGIILTSDNFFERKRNFTRADGKVQDVGRDNFIAYYSPSFVIPPEDSPYFPVDIPENDPYKYNFDISGMLKDGDNVLVIKNSARIERDLIIGDLKIIKKENKK